MKNSREIFEREIDFYYQNIVNGYKINKKAKENLVKRTDNNYDLLIEITNYDELGLVEYVANDQFEIDYENKEILIEE